MEILEKIASAVVGPALDYRSLTRLGSVQFQTIDIIIDIVIIGQKI